jgi:hypothetical protein
MELGLPCIQHQEVACLGSNIISKNKLKEIRIGINVSDLVLQIESIPEFRGFWVLNVTDAVRQIKNYARRESQLIILRPTDC